MPLLIRYPEEIGQGRSDEMVMNLDFAPTFLDYAGIEIPAEMQGESMRPMLKGEGQDAWRKEVYYHYYEYPKGGHYVKRHYGVRTERYKLIHYYFDIDEWELFDLEQDPAEMFNLYGQPGYEGITDSLKEKLKELRVKYQDNNQADFLPKMAVKQIENRAHKAQISYEFPFSKKYTGGGERALLDGMISIDDLSYTENRQIWQGFEGDDLVVTLDLGEKMILDTVSVGFLHNIDAWIFSPRWVEIATSLDNISFSSMGKIENKLGNRSMKEQRLSFTQKMEGRESRYLRIRAKNIEKCPEWHKGAGNKAWLFADEIVLQ
jgi:hypothetical protein